MIGGGLSPDDAPDELQHLGIGLPHDLDRQLGYDDARGLTEESDARYLAVWWTPHGDEVIVSDGYVARDGNWQNFMRWDRNAGKAMLRLAAEAHDDFEPEDVDQTWVPRLTRMLLEAGLDIGSSDTVGNAALLIDRDTNELYAGEREHVRHFVERFNEPPPSIDGLPNDPEALKELFERAFDDVDPEDLFGGEHGP